VPYARFKDVNDKLKGLMQELETLKAERSSTTPGEVNLTAEIARYQSEARDAWHDDPDRALRAVQAASRLQAQDEIQSTLNDVMAAQKQEQQKAQFLQANQQYVEKALREFPWVKTDEALRKEVEAEHAADIFLQQSPSGWYDATTRVAARHQTTAVPLPETPPSFESGGTIGPPPASSQELSKEYNAQLERLRQGAAGGSVVDSELQAFFEKYKPWKESGQ
jgi:hypothetical protein